MVSIQRLSPGHAAACFASLMPVIMVLSSCGRAPEAVVAEVRPVRVITIASTAGGRDVTLTGRVQARTEVNQSFRLPGQLIERRVDIGDTVRAGQLLARLDSQNEQSGLQGANAQQIAARVQLDDARNNFNRMRNLIGDNAVSRAAYENAQAMLRTAEAQVKAVGAQVELAQSRVNFTSIRADAPGVVTARGPEVGEVVAAGQMIVQIAQAGALDAIFDVPARIKDSARGDATIWVALTNNPGIRARGRIREIAPRADPVTGTFRVRIAVANAPSAMRLGSTVTGTLPLLSAPGIAVPTSALTRVGGKPAVWIVDPKTSTVVLRPVATGAGADDQVRIESGLNPGDKVVTAGVQVLRPGQKVSLLETTP